MKSVSRISNLAAASLLLTLAAPVSLRAQVADSRLEMQELKTTLQISAAQIQELQQRLDRAKEQINALSDSLASANGEGRQAREAYEKLRIQMEGLGIAALDPSQTELQQRLLTALSDLRILEGYRRSLTEALVGLSESSLAYARNAPTPDATVRENLNKALAAAEKAMSGAKLAAAEPADQADLQNARVVSVKEEMGIAILNVGSRHGVHPGMPFAIYRKEKPVAHALVVDVRQGICGAVVRELVTKDDPVKVGDNGRVETSKG